VRERRARVSAIGKLIGRQVKNLMQ